MTTGVQNAIGVLRSIACRPLDGNTMTEITSCNVLPGRGIDSENRKSGQREVTLISAEQWADVCRELRAEIPWYSRRANFLVSGVDLAATIGRSVSIGPVRIQIHGETKPCGIMESQHAGLRKTLEPQCRGGVYGQVLTGGRVQVGDVVSVE